MSNQPDPALAAIPARIGARPTLALDLFSDAAIRDPNLLYRAVLDHAPAVWLSAHDVWALGRYGDLHRRRRAVVMKQMMPRALAEVEVRITALAEDVIADLLERDSFDGVADFARRLPVAVVSQLVGLPEEGRERLRDWGAAAFDASPAC